MLACQGDGRRHFAPHRLVLHGVGGQIHPLLGHRVREECGHAIDDIAARNGARARRGRSCASADHPRPSPSGRRSCRGRAPCVATREAPPGPRPQSARPRSRDTRAHGCAGSSGAACASRGKVSGCGRQDRTSDREPSDGGAILVGLRRECGTFAEVFAVLVEPGEGVALGRALRAVLARHARLAPLARRGAVLQHALAVAAIVEVPAARSFFSFITDAPPPGIRSSRAAARQASTRRMAA